MSYIGAKPAEQILSSADIQDGAISTVDLANGAITQAKVASGVAGTGPAFSAYGTANQSLANNTSTKIAFNTEVFDTNSNYDTTNYRFTPTVAGYYLVTAVALFNGAASGRGVVYFHVNGTAKGSLASAPLNSANAININLTSLLYFNGTTDYVECYINQNSGGTITGGSSSDAQSFSAVLVRGA